jgi:hypothetical protein
MEVTIIPIWMVKLGTTLRRRALEHQGQEASPGRSYGDLAQFDMLTRVRAEASALPILSVNRFTRQEAQQPRAVGSGQCACRRVKPFLTIVRGTAKGHALTRTALPAPLHLASQRVNLNIVTNENRKSKQECIR